MFVLFLRQTSVWAEVYGPEDLMNSQFTVCWMDRLPPALIFDHHSFPRCHPVVFVILTLRIWGVNCCCVCCFRLSFYPRRGSYRARLSLFLNCFSSRTPDGRDRILYVCVRRGVDDSSFDPGVLVVKSCLRLKRLLDTIDCDN